MENFTTKRKLGSTKEDELCGVVNINGSQTARNTAFHAFQRCVLDGFRALFGAGTYGQNSMISKYSDWSIRSNGNIS